MSPKFTATEKTTDSLKNYPVSFIDRPVLASVLVQNQFAENTKNLLCNKVDSVATLNEGEKTQIKNIVKKIFESNSLTSSVNGDTLSALTFSVVNKRLKKVTDKELSFADLQQSLERIEKIITSNTFRRLKYYDESDVDKQHKRGMAAYQRTTLEFLENATAKGEKNYVSRFP